MSTGVVATEEMRDSLAMEFSGLATAGQVAVDLAVSTSTARRHLEVLVERGWVVKQHEGRSVTYLMTPRGWQSYDQNERL